MDVNKRMKASESIDKIRKSGVFDRGKSSVEIIREMREQRTKSILGINNKIQDIREKLEDSTIAVSTIIKNKPHTIFILYPKVIENNIIITDNYMKTTIENIKTNQNICLAFFEIEKGWRINGKAKYYNSGKWLEFVKKLKENNGLPAKGAIVIEVEEVKELG